MNMLKSFFKNFFYYNCICCGVGVGDSRSVLCDDCLRALLAAKKYKKPGISCAVSYKTRSGRSLVLYMKDYKDKDAFNFSASLIHQNLYMDGYENLGDYYITFAPRNPITKLKKKFDQSEEIGKCLALEMFGTTDRCISTITRSFRSSQQKELSAEQRRMNVEGTLSLKKNITLPKKLIVIDDVTTTGETLYAIRDILKENGVEECILFAFAYNRKGDY